MKCSKMAARMLRLVLLNIQINIYGREKKIQMELFFVGVVVGMLILSS